ncbi:hypothetical protein EVA_19785 [gut metagenome]|uniref:Uncharacterized protein n=1 Tax=gut metagenome TaxID=749906 RepID=J9FCG1_9ZZZZ
MDYSTWRNEQPHHGCLLPQCPLCSLPHGVFPFSLLLPEALFHL